MKHKAKYLLFIILSFGLLSFVNHIIPTDEFLSLLQKKLNIFNKEKQREFIYLMSDKTFYKPGENIWFAAWVTEGNYLKATQKSQVLYVDLIDPKGKITESLKLPVFSGRSNGDFELDGNVAGGIYKLKAYTNYTKNFGKQYVFEKEITVQKVLIPRLLMKLDFQKEAYGPGDIVKADFNATNLENQAISLQAFKYSIFLNGKLLEKIESKTDAEGKSTIEFKLPDSLTTNDGLINVQLDYDGEKESISRSIPIILNQIEISFYPEGGKLLANTNTNVAFKAVNEFGKPADFTAVLLDDNNIEIDKVESFYQGFGSFRFVPEKSKNYKLRITKPKGIDKEYHLPRVSENGFSLHLIVNKLKQLQFEWFSDSNSEVYLVASIRDIIYYSEKIKSVQGKNEIIINKENWPAGIAKISMFNKERVLVSERLVYIGERSPMNITIEKDKEFYKPGDSVKLRIRAKTPDSKPVRAKVAISVIDNKIHTFADDKQDNILSYLLMSNELNENIEEPLYYFSEDKEKAWDALDLVLMCSTIKRLSWLEIIDNYPQVHFMAESQGVLSGRVVNKKTREGIEATVWLTQNNSNNLESEGKTVHIKTGPEGYFTFLNFNPNEFSFLFAQSQSLKSKDIQILTMDDLKNSADDFSKYVKDIPEEILIKKIKKDLKIRKKIRLRFPSLNLNLNSVSSGSYSGYSSGSERANLGGGLSMESSDGGLQECVVVGYGFRRKTLVAGASDIIRNQELFDENIIGALNGKAAEVQIIENRPGAFHKKKVRIRGNNLINNNSNPLFIIDGISMELSQNQDFDPFSFINPQDVESVIVYKSSKAQALYGSRAANGAIVIETKRKTDYSFTSERKNISSPFASRIISPQENRFSLRRRFDAYLQTINNNGSRSDFRSTLFWDPLIETDENGEATVSFVNSDEVSSFKIVAEGISENGEPGRGESEYHTSLPVFVTAKMPDFLCFSDTVKIPVMINNNTGSDISGRLEINYGHALVQLDKNKDELLVKSGEKKIINLSCFVDNKAGIDSLEIGFYYNEFSDKLNFKYEVVPVGFPVLESFASDELDKEYEVELDDVLTGSLKMQLTAYPSVVTDIFSGVEGLLREPYGCFEQTSVTSYPNLLVMDYLKTIESDSKEALNKAQGLLKMGYNRLISFETPSKGYEWFGSSPGHEALTAYGLMQFNDMKSVCSYVDNSMIARTSEWLLRARDGNGKFKRNSLALDTYGSADETITNAYIVYALCEAGYKNLKLEYETSFTEAVKSNDPYMYALMANVALILKDTRNSETLLNLLYKEQNQDGSWNGKKHSITCSSGSSLIVETTSLVVLAIMKSENPDREVLNDAIRFLINSRSGYGNFGSTQATILALKAITQYAKFSKRTNESGTIEIYVNGQKVARTSYKEDEDKPVVMDGLGHFLKSGKNKIRVKYIDCKRALPYSVAVNWRAKTPQSNEKCKLKLDCQLETNNILLSDVVRLAVELKNISENGLPMSMVKIGIPGGLSPQPWQLKELRDKGIIDFYEIFNNYLVFYFRQMAPEEVKNINLDLKADMAGNYEGVASCAYLYYTDEFKNWVKGLKIRIQE